MARTCLRLAGIWDEPASRPVLRNLVVAEHAQNSGIGTRLVEACERHVQSHWQMKELVVEVDDLWGDQNEGSHCLPVQAGTRRPAIGASR
jgi:GNAT superfamily N-acetyltransferase